MIAPKPTPSASALHLLYAMRKSLGHALYWQSSELPALAHGVPGREQLDPEDPGLTVLAKLINCAGQLQQFTVSDLRFGLRAKLINLAQGWEANLPILVRMNDLKEVPAGWRQIDLLWECLAGVPLTEALLQHPIHECVDPSDDFSQGWKYEVMAFDSTMSPNYPDDVPDFDTHDLDASFYGNDLPELLKHLPAVSRVCDEELKQIAAKATGGEEWQHLNDVCLKVLKAKGGHPRPFEPHFKTVMHLCMDPMDCAEFPPEGRFDPRDLVIERDGQACVKAIETAFGSEVAALHAEHCLGLDLGL